MYSHRVFQDIAAVDGLPGLPDFLRADDVFADVRAAAPATRRATSSSSARTPRLQWAIVFVRTARRSVHFGEREMPDDVDEVIVNRDGLEAMLAGTYWT